MSRFFIFALCICAVFASDMTRETIQIDGKFYFFEDTPLGRDWNGAARFCSNQPNMVMAGFETDAEFNSVMQYMISSGKTGGYWTSGQWSSGNTWTWGGSGTLDSNDPRWDAGEPGTGPWDMERVSFTVESGAFKSDDMALTYNVICEGGV